MKEINFITIGDKNYFPFISFSIKQITKFYPTSKLFIYDWGFTSNQRNKIKSYSNTVLIDWKDKLNMETGYKTIKKKYGDINLTLTQRKKNYLLNQKPICLLDCAKRIDNNLIFFDGDVILINPIDEIFEDNYDIGLSVKFYGEHKNISKGFSSRNWGVNSGVIFFKLNSIPMQIFIQEWINEIKTCERWLMEQTSLNTLIRDRNKEIFKKNYNVGTITLSNTEFKIKAFPGSIYNFIRISDGYDDKKVKFLHLMKLTRGNRLKKQKITYSYKIRFIIREIKLRKGFSNILKLVSPILPFGIKKFIKENFNNTLVFKLIQLIGLILMNLGKKNNLNIYLIKLSIGLILMNLKKKIRRRKINSFHEIGVKNGS